MVAPVLCVWLLPVLAACGVATLDPTPTPAPATHTPVVAATPTPDTELFRDGGAAIIQRAFDRLLDEYIEPLDSSRILDGAWTLLAQRAAEESLDVPEKPGFSDDRIADFELFRTAYASIASQSTDPTQLRYAAIRGMTEALQDCHTFFLSPVANDTLVGQREGNGVVGIGVELAGVPPLVTEVITAGPADRAGVRVGDLLVAVDDVDISGGGPAAAFERINGAENTKVTITMERPDEPAPIDITITRENVNPPNIETRIIDETIGYLRVRNFVDGGIAVQLRQTLDAFETQGVTSWIIDMRGNPGGRLDTDAISLFVPDGVIVRDRNRAGELHEDLATGRVLTTIRPAVVLTNNRTGSVAEVFVAALKEYGVAYVVGANTNGCVGYTDVRELGDDSSLAVTTNVNLGPVTGEELAGVGVAPDELVGRTADDIAALLDPQLDAAVAHLQAVAGTTGQ
ncbi:MAG: PDZ domain-containing protein [Chloroflexi bacterium]|nr:PDZ domain-containing protein [Chloroflexota bacterium]